MKKLKYMAVALTVATLGLTSCDLEEYNPSGSTAEQIYVNQQGIQYLVNSAYYNFKWKFYGREDPVLYMESGTDCFINAKLGSYGWSMSQYVGMDATVSQFNTLWTRLYDNVNICNTGLAKIEAAEYKDESVRLYHEAEFRFMRAYTYWWLVEFFGDIQLIVDEVTEPLLEAHRTKASDIYDQVILPDLRRAAQILPATSYDGAVDRPTSKAAYGMLARAALTRAAYGDASTFYNEALTAAKYVIENRNALGTDLYDDYDDVWKQENNKNNKEALWVCSHSEISSYNPSPSNPNRLFMYYNPDYIGLVGCQQSMEYGRDNATSNSAKQMPTKYMLTVFDEYDARYPVTFREEIYCNTPGGYDWTTADIERFGKPASMLGTHIDEGDLALYYTRKVIPQSVKDAAPYAIVDLDMVYDTDGSIKVTPYNAYYPRLNKFRELKRETTDSQVGTNDVFLIRLAEMYLIAAEAEIGLNRPDNAVPYITDLRKRALTPGYESRLAVTAADMTVDFILDERARELCGEHIRWFDLKRTGNLYTWVKKNNPNVTNIQPYHVLRPIPRDFLQSIINPEEFGQNDGY